MRHLWLCRPGPSLSNVLQLLLWAVTLTLVTALAYCPSGTHMSRHGSGEDICLLCEEGQTFMSEENHRHRQCFTCSQVVRPEVEVVIRECDLQHDTIIQCKDGFYRKRARNARAKDECVPCSICDHVNRPCMNYTDAVCCGPNYDAVLTSAEVFHCKERPIVCQPGQFFNNKTEQCLPCPPNTYMPDSDHNHTSCVKCAVLHHSSTFNSDIFNNCSSHSPTLFGCKKGYFRNIYEPSLVLEANCTKCDACTETGILITCSDFQDSVCKSLCMENDTSTVSTPQTSTPFSCEGGQCSTRSQNSSDHNVTLFDSEPSPKCDNMNLTLVISLAVSCIVCTNIITVIIVKYKSVKTVKTEEKRETELMMKHKRDNKEINNDVF